MIKPGVLIDFGKLKNLYTGLGQVSYQYATALLDSSYGDFNFTYLVPEDFKGKFGDSVSYKSLSFLQRHFPLLNGKFDLWHAIHQDSGYMPPPGVPYLLTIHDLNFLEEKKSSKAALRLKRLQKKTDRATVLTFISKFTQEVAKKHLKINVPTEVIYNGVNIEGFDRPRRPSFFDFLSGFSEKPEPLYFTVGVIKAKKNFHVLVRFMEMLNQGLLVIAGDNTDSYARSMQTEINRLGLGRRIVMPGIISDEDRAWLYENCNAFFFPSVIEGFGLPVIEAMSRGKPVFLSTFSSLPEVGGGDAFYWQNFEPEYMVSVFKREMKSAMDPQKVISRKNRAAFFNWNDAVVKYTNLYKKIIDHEI